MPTAKAIEEITDAGEFEILATRVLRHVDPDYERLEHLGVNAEGKTVKNPVDGFCKVPGSRPSRYVMAAFSTDLPKRIERKLLFDHTKSTGKKYKDVDDGDLVKAGRLAANIREQDGDAEFVFTFCTNKQPDDKLMQKGYAAGKIIGIEVRFLARSAIRDHLDTTQDGQWLRKEHLGIDANTLSVPLLREIASASVRQYSYELFCSDSKIVETTTTKRLAKCTRQNQPSIHVLIGGSGSGKSVASYQVLADIVADGGVGLWIPAEIIAASASMDVAITDTLRTIIPTLGSEAGHDFVTLAAHSNVPFVVVVDDVNRTTNAAQQVRKLISWHNRMTAGEAAKSGAAHHANVPHLIVPVWNHYWSPIEGRYRNTPTVGEVNAQPMNSEEALECLRRCSKRPLDHETASEIARRLEYDPILIGLWGELYGDKPAEHLDADTSTLIEDYINRAINEDSADSMYLPADIRAAIETLAARLLEERDLYPAWSRVSDWLSESQLDAVRHISVSGRICRVVRRNDIDKFEFRHDRLLETALTKPFSERLADVDNNLDVLSDPFFAESVARTVVTTEDQQLIEKLRKHAPLVVLSVIRHITDAETSFAEATAVAAKEWLVEATGGKETPPEMLFAASRILEATQNPLVLAVTEDVKDDRRFAGARLVNGDTVHGKSYVASRSFFPNSRAPFIEDLVARALRQHRDAMCQELAEGLNSGHHSERELHAALILAGYFGETSLAVPVLAAWRHDSENQSLVEALWASMRCSDAPESTLAPLLDSWATLSDESDQYGNSERGKVFSHLQFCVRHGLRECVIEFLAKRAEHDDRLSVCLAGLLQRIDHPIAVTSVATKVAQIERRIEGTDRFSWWVMHCRENWDPLRVRANRLSDASRNAILLLWEQSEEEWLQKSLLRTWIISTDSVHELRELPEVVATSKSAMWRRACLGDRSIEDAILERLAEDFHWWHVVPSIWTSRFVEPLDQALQELAKKTPADYSGGTSDDHYCLAEVLRDIPTETAEELLLKHWESLKYSTQFVQIALYVGGKTLLAAADEVVQKGPDSWNPFEHVSFTFGLKTVGLQDRLTDKHIDALLPYIQKLSDMEVMEIAEWLADRGRYQDLRNQIFGEIAKRVAAQQTEGDNSYIIRLNRVKFPSDCDLLDQLSEIENDERLVWSWCRYATDRGDSPKRIRNVLGTWFLDQPSPERLQIAAKIVLELGQRDDVAWLQKCQEEYGDEKTKTIVDGATFAVRHRTLS